MIGIAKFNPDETGRNYSFFFYSVGNSIDIKYTTNQNNFMTRVPSFSYFLVKWQILHTYNFNLRITTVI